MKKRKLAGENIDNKAFLILDDCLYDADWKKDKRIKEIFYEWKVIGIFNSCLIMQYALRYST